MQGSVWWLCTQKPCPAYTDHGLQTAYALQIMYEVA